MTCICPHCGYSLDRDAPIELDGFKLDPRGTASFNGKPLRVSPTHVMILHSIAAVRPRVLSKEVLAERIGCDSDSFDVVIRTQICRLNRHLRDHGAPTPLRRVWGKGYQWLEAA